MKEILEEALEEFLKKKGYGVVAEIFNNIGWVLTAKDYLQLGLCINAIKAIPLTEKAIEQREKIKENKISQRNKVIAEIRKKCECALPDEYRPKSKDETH